MSTPGKICLSIALLLWLLLLAPIPGIWGGWAPKLLVAQNEWATELRDARQKTADAIEREARSRAELNSAITNVQAATFGWDKFWTVPVRGQGDASAPTINKQQGGRLIVNNLGAAQGIIAETKMIDGQQQLVKPVIHAFYGGANGYTYAGEFTAENITANRFELIPVHAVPPQFVQSWNVNAQWRLRSMIPAGDRTALDSLYRQRRRLNQLTTDLQASLVQQQELLAAAEKSLETRKGELLGNPANTPIENRPEFRDGLVRVTEQTEESRNQLALEVDTLRREILDQIQQREAQIQEVQRLLDQLPTANSSAQIADRTSASGS